MVDYNGFAKSFSESRKNMKWEEIEYFLESNSWDGKKVLDVGCGNGRLFWEFLLRKEKIDYLWVDLSEKLLQEGKKIYPNAKFQWGNMLNINFEKEEFDAIFLIASFHHLESFEERVLVLQNLEGFLRKWGRIFMTNWALESDLNMKKYRGSKIKEGDFWSADFLIKIGKFQRYYHCFSLLEIEKIVEKTNLKIMENREFENGKNFVTILEK